MKTLGIVGMMVILTHAKINIESDILWILNLKVGIFVLLHSGNVSILFLFGFGAILASELGSKYWLFSTIVAFVVLVNNRILNLLVLELCR